MSQEGTAKASNVRAWVITNRAAPDHQPSYAGRSMVDALNNPAGDLTPIWEPNPFRYGEFDIVEETRGAPALATTTLTRRFRLDEISDWLALKRQGCPIDVQLHLGKCRNPDDFNGGFESMVVLENARLSAWNTTPFGTLDQAGDGPINESIPISYRDTYQVAGSLRVSEVVPSTVTREIIDGVICDIVSCGNCGPASDGCGKIFFISVSAGGSPGLPADLVYSKNNGVTWAKTNVSTLLVSEAPTALACVGPYLVVSTNTGLGIHYALQASILAGSTGIWTENNAGIVASKGPNALFSAGPTRTWAAGDGGYIYYWEDISATAVVQEAGVLSVQNLTAIHGSDASNIVAVGASNAIVRTQDGGESWDLVVGPSPAVALNTIWVFDRDRWLVGNASGSLYYTNDAGVSWTAILFPGNASGSVRDLYFSRDGLGFMSHSTSTPAGRIMRSIDGGRTWVVQPTSGTAPTSQRYNVVVGCPQDVNLFYAGGLGATTDGVIVKGA